MNVLRFCALTVGLLLVSLAPLLLAGSWDGRTRLALLLGALLAAVNAGAGYACVHWAARRSMRALLVAVLGGMTARMLLLLSLVAVAVVAVRLPAMPLACSLMAYFALFLTLELIALPRLFRVATS
jgi:hypothetical protein